MKRIPDDGMFRAAQSFSLLSAHHLLEKLKWDIDELERLRWGDNVGDTGRQVVSYKAVDCAATAWHLAAWFENDLFGIEPCLRAAAYLDLEIEKGTIRFEQGQIWNAAIELWPDLDLCRIIASATANCQISADPRPEVSTNTYLAMARRGDEAHLRQVVWLAVNVNAMRFNFVDVIRGSCLFWQGLHDACWPGTDGHAKVRELPDRLIGVPLKVSSRFVRMAREVFQQLRIRRR